MEYIKAIRKSIIYGNQGSKRPNVNALELELKLKINESKSLEDIIGEYLWNKTL